MLKFMRARFKNVAVTITPESRLESRKIQVLGLERKVKLNPYVKKVHLALPKPTLCARAEKIELISKKARYLELANDSDFNQEFIKALSFPQPRI